MKNLKLICLFALAATLAFGQSAPLVGSTTLAGSITASGTQACVTSATGITNPSISAVGSFFFVDNEAIQNIGAGVSTTCFRVKRGVLGTKAQAHANLAVLWIGAATTSSGDTSRPLSSNLFPLGDAGAVPIATPIPAFGGPATSAAAPVAGTLYWSTIEVARARAVTGVCVLNGATAGGTDNHIFFIYDAGGNLLGQTAATATSGTSQYQCQALTTPVEVQGPSRYYIGFQSNGTTDLVLKYVTGQTGTTFAAGSQTGTSGTIPTTLTTTNTFTTAKGPLAVLY